MDSSIEYNILQERLLQEAFLDSIKNYAKDKLNQTVDTIKDWKDAAVVFGKILSNEELLKDFLPPLQRRFENTLKSLYDFLKKIGLDSFINIIDDIKNKILSLEGLKKFVFS
jgi:L-cysteine desulfidase